MIQAMTALNNRAEILSDQGHLDAASADFREAARTWKAARYSIGAALATSNLGRVAARGGDFEAAERWLAEASDIFTGIGASSLVLEVRLRRAEAALLAGDQRRAETAAEGLRSALERPDTEPSQRAGIRRCLAVIAAQRDELVTAEEELLRSLREARDASAPFELVQGLLIAERLCLIGRSRLTDLEDPGPILARLGIESIAVPRLEAADIGGSNG